MDVLYYSRSYNLRKGKKTHSQMQNLNKNTYVNKCTCGYIVQHIEKTTRKNKY